MGTEVKAPDAGTRAEAKTDANAGASQLPKSRTLREGAQRDVASAAKPTALPPDQAKLLEDANGSVYGRVTSNALRSDYCKVILNRKGNDALNAALDGIEEAAKAQGLEGIGRAFRKGNDYKMSISAKETRDALANRLMELRDKLMKGQALTAEEQKELRFLVDSFSALIKVVENDQNRRAQWRGVKDVRLMTHRGRQASQEASPEAARAACVKIAENMDLPSRVALLKDPDWMAKLSHEQREALREEMRLKKLTPQNVAAMVRAVEGQFAKMKGGATLSLHDMAEFTHQCALLDSYYRVAKNMHKSWSPAE